MDAVAVEELVARSLRDETDPVLADRVLGIVLVELLAGPRIHPVRVDELAVVPNHERAQRRAVVLAEAHAERADVCPPRLRTPAQPRRADRPGRRQGPGVQVQPKARLAHHGVERAANDLQLLPDAEGIGVGQAIHALDEVRLGDGVQLSADPDEVVALHNRVQLLHRVAGVQRGREDDLLVQRRERLPKRSPAVLAQSRVHQHPVERRPSIQQLLLGTMTLRNLIERGELPGQIPRTRERITHRARRTPGRSRRRNRRGNRSGNLSLCGHGRPRDGRLNHGRLSRRNRHARPCGLRRRDNRRGAGKRLVRGLASAPDHGCRTAATQGPHIHDVRLGGAGSGGRRILRRGRCWRRSAGVGERFRRRERDARSRLLRPTETHHIDHAGADRQHQPTKEHQPHARPTLSTDRGS